MLCIEINLAPTVPLANDIHHLPPHELFPRINVQTDLQHEIPHIGGFVAGVVIAWIFLKLYYQPPREQRRELLYERAKRYRY